MTALYTLGILSTNFMRDTFTTVLKEFPQMLSTCWLLFLHFAVQLIPNYLNWVEVKVIVEARSSDAALHHTPWSNSHYTAWRCVLGHCPVEKQMILPLYQRWTNETNTKTIVFGWNFSLTLLGLPGTLTSLTFPPSHFMV